MPDKQEGGLEDDSGDEVSSGTLAAILVPIIIVAILVMAAVIAAVGLLVFCRGRSVT